MIPNRIVIDTNVCLDLFFFRDARWEMLYDALRQRRVEAVTRADCRKEWLFVLGYPHLAITDDLRPEVAERFDAVISCLSMESCAAATTPLPVCKDPHDQKFLELARDSRASVLLTKDKAVLKLARRTVKAGLFRILHPDEWVKDYKVQANLPPADTGKPATLVPIGIPSTLRQTP